MAKKVTEDTDRAALITMRENRKALERSAAKNNPWRFSMKGQEALQASMSMISTKTGLFAKIPLICKGENCPYAEQCPLIEYDLAPVGEVCAQEAAQIELRTKAYAQDFDIDSMSFVDKVLLNEIVGLDIMIERCRALMANEGSPVIDVLTDVADDGTEIRQPMVSKAWDVYERVSKKRDTTYQLMMMTRKDKKKEGNDDENQALSDMLNNVITAEEIAEIDEPKKKKKK